ncbi:Vir protein, partial [Winogradskyella sp. KYW1333]
MKKLHTILAVILITATTSAQVPEKMSYQAVVRDASGALVSE